MNARTRRSLAVTLGVAGAMLPLTAGFASAAEDPTEGYPSTQNPLQVLPALGATGGNGLYSLTDTLNGANRPDGADGTESRIPGLDNGVDYRLVEGLVGGLLVNGPFE